MNELQTIPQYSGPTVFYFEAEDKNSPELLLFSEDSIKDSKWKRASQKGRRIWQSMKYKFEQYSIEAFASDRFIWKMHTLHNLRILLNKPIDPAVVRARLRTILKDRSDRHLRWLIIDSLLLPLTFFTMFLPGPNVWFFYLIFRIYAHWKSYRSAATANVDSARIDISNDAEEVNAFIRKSKDIRTALTDIRGKYGLRALQEHQFIPQTQTFKNAWKSLGKKLTPQH